MPEPTYDEVYRDWPAGIAKAEPRPTRIIWNLVCSGNQPEMASAWMACGRARAAVSDEDSAGPGLREHPVLGDHALDQLPLLHGPLRDAAGGRRAVEARDRHAHPDPGR